VLKVISSRFGFNNSQSVYLNRKRIKIRNIVQDNLNAGKYHNETVNCYVCNSRFEDHELLSEKERHGLELQCVICKRCGLVFTNPRMDKDSFGDFYTKFYRDLYNYNLGENNLDSLHNSNYENGKFVHEFVKPFIKNQSKVLEIGCANGGLLKFFREQGHFVTGLDLGEAEVIYGKDKFGLNLIHKSIDDFESDEKQDLIIMIHVIEHLIEPEITMNKINQNLSESGLLYISCPDIDILPNGLIYKSDWLTLMQNAHTINFDKLSITNLLNKYGFEVIYFEPGMNLIAKKTNKSNTEFKNNYINTLSTIKQAESNFQKRAMQNRIRNLLETNGVFAFLIYVSGPINTVLVKLRIQRYIKSILKFFYKFI
jgi:2-polyprenyl-3-methyl-5-hydroxy-6-metoxy-1,4-benzoquinol methylase